MTALPGIDATVEQTGGIDIIVQQVGGVDVTVEQTGDVEVTLALPGIQGPPGPPGEPGPRGEPGPPGPEGGAYQEDIAVASAALWWEVEHTLARDPRVTTFDSNGDIVQGDVSYPTPTSVRVTWWFPMSGVMRLN